MRKTEGISSNKRSSSGEKNLDDIRPGGAGAPIICEIEMTMMDNE